MFWLFPAVGAAILAAMPAPIKQRDEARKYAHEQEAHAREYAEWATRREMADDFKFNTLEEARSMDQWNLPPAEIEERWRGNAAVFSRQIVDHGAGPEVTGEIDRQLEALERREDPPRVSAEVPAGPVASGAGGQRDWKGEKQHAVHAVGRAFQ